MSQRLTATAGLLVAMLLAGCASRSPKPPQPVEPPPEFLQPTAATELHYQAQMQLPGYRLNFGDELEIIYQIRHDVQPEDYRLKIEDKINIRFPFQPELNQSLAIPSDGKLNLLLLDDPVSAFDKTVTELTRELKGKYGKFV